jgi:hypothetical protein
MLTATKAGVCAIVNTYHHTEVWSSEYRNLMEARENISRYLDKYNQDRPHRGVGNRTPKVALGSFAVLSKNEALTA